MKIAVIGSINVDLMYTIEKELSRGETITADTYQILSGGKGANQGVIANAIHDDLVFLGAIGNDAFGKKVITDLQNKALNTDYIVTKEDSTGLAVIEVYKGDNSIVVFPGANAKLSQEDIDTFYNTHSDIQYVVSQMEIDLEVVEYLLEEAHKRHIKTILNPAPAAKIKESVLDKVDYIIPNESETKILFDSDHYEQLITSHQGRLLITLGSKGVMLYHHDEVITLPAKTVDVVDTTGAGDSFIAGFTVGLARGYDLKKAAELGTEIAAITCQYYGAQSGIDHMKKKFKT